MQLRSGRHYGDYGGKHTPHMFSPARIAATLAALGIGGIQRLIYNYQNSDKLPKSFGALSLPVATKADGKKKRPSMPFQYPKSLKRRRTRKSYSKLRYVTRGYYGGRVKKRRAVKADKFSIDGSVLHYENGGVVSDNNCVYLGMSTNPIQQTLIAVCRSVVKELYRQLNVEVNRWDEPSPTGTNDLTIEIFYTQDTSGNSETSAGAGTLSSGNTPDIVARLMAAQFVNILDSHPTAQFRKITVTGSQAGGFQRMACIYVKNFSFHLESIGSFSFQNRTLGADGLQVYNDITNNPVIGKTYYGQGNYFAVREELNQPDEVQPFQGYIDKPLFGVSSLENQNPVTKKPIDAYSLLNCRKSYGLQLAPGQIKYVKLKYSKWFNLQNFLTVFAQPIAAINRVVPEEQRMPHKLGKIFMVGVEKMLNDRASTQVVSIGYECNLTLKCRSRYRKGIPSVPIIEEPE